MGHFLEIEVVLANGPFATPRGHLIAWWVRRDLRNRELLLANERRNGRWGGTAAPDTLIAMVAMASIARLFFIHILISLLSKLGQMPVRDQDRKKKGRSYPPSCRT